MDDSGVDLDNEIFEISEAEFTKSLETDFRSLTVGDWALVEFSSKKLLKYYVG